ncbi:MAG: helix-turn-helix domain-containing protein [Ketobacteraceae bacterium]|nr:helix-turn-helix domain-containing protein [Ketobacteraceae bacterium]
MANSSQLYLWNDRTLYIGPAPQRSCLSFGSACLVVFLDANATLRFQDQFVTAQTFLISSGCAFEVDRHQGRAAVLLLDSLGYEYHALQGTMMHRTPSYSWHSMTEKAVAQTFRTIFRGNYGARDLYHWMRSLTRPEEYMKASRYVHDARIEKAMTLIKNYGATPMDIMDCAQQVGVSVIELEALFRRHLGLSIKGFRAWRLLGDTITYAAEGDDLGTASRKAGFRDEHQYLRVFSRHFGMHPRALAKYAQGTDIYIYKKPIASEEPKEALYSAPDFFELV